MQRKLELAEMVTQVLHEQKKQELYWERLQKKKLEDTLSYMGSIKGGSIKGTSIKGRETGVVLNKHFDEFKVRAKELATRAGRERVKREFAETQTKFEISGPEQKDGLVMI